ncbi:hypothetical protein AB0M28_12755 [Streptomyces sp. NPDC051940]|uniref:DUF7019 family protein n=1 Tax=Streptomyces sp. NPDC051940 TaxID=3155675 RepID=UPI0034248C04
MKYKYWSNRRVLLVAEDNGIRPGPAATASLGVNLGVFQAQVQEPAGQIKQRTELADAVERVIGDQAEVTFARLPAVEWAEGAGTVHFSEVHGQHETEAVVLHVRTADPQGRQVDLCLFGSREHTRPFRMTEMYERQDVGSGLGTATQLITNFDDRLREGEHLRLPVHPQLAWAAVRLAAHYERPLAERERLYVSSMHLEQGPECEWFAEIYCDVVLPEMFRSEGYHRVLIGAPLWVRTATPETLERYRRAREGRASPLTRLLRRPGSRGPGEAGS